MKNKADVGISLMNYGLAAKLSPKQIEIWRKILFGTLGSYALIIPDEQVQEIKDEMQSSLNKLDD